VDQFENLLNLEIALEEFRDEEFFSASCLGDKNIIKTGFKDEVCAR
jgi:hypothetical protein